MAARKILVYPQDRTALRRKSEPVGGINREIRQLIKDLKETLLLYPTGIGLAAPQINVHLRLVVVRLGARNETQHEAEWPIALINPEIVEASNERKDFDGCLSFPGLFGETIRPHFLRVLGLNEEGKFIEREFTDFDAVLVHHEIDHLDGILFIDRIKCLADLYRISLDRSGKLVQEPLEEIDPLFRSKELVG